MSTFTSLIDNCTQSAECLGQGSNGLVFKLTIDDKDFAVKIIIANNPNIYLLFEHKEQPYNVEVMTLKRLNQSLLETKMTPHITLYVNHFIYKGLPPCVEYNKLFTERYKNSYHKQTMTIITEYAQYGSLRKYIKAGQMTPYLLQIVVFQAIFTLAQIQDRLPGFRHNDTHTDNWLVQIDNNYVKTPRGRLLKNNESLSDVNRTLKPKYYIYYFNDNFYRIPICPISLKLWDFDFSTQVGVMNNAKINCQPEHYESFGCRSNYNRYYDLHLLCNDLLMLNDSDSVYKNNYLNIKDEFPIIHFLNDIIPLENYGYGGHHHQRLFYGRLIPDEDPHSPQRLLTKHPFIQKEFAVSLQQINMDSVVDCFGIKMEILEFLVARVTENETI
jgi:hypothetical protein